ncbi:MAG: aminotransferase class I/II-fold pyridoxal phosphate-dependent enzyme, partial [Erysipelotrichaceae bacterium]|nr:aminotransferase class I/II-fold pyridoxal phosphate-dependent enzyme [Erysipelotrichaceae bacterium]
MTFTKKSANLVPLTDPVFSVVKLAKEDIAANGAENVINATIGSLYGENEKIVALETVFNHYDEIAKESKAAYAASYIGNPTYREQVYNWVTRHKTDSLEHFVIATPGGTGAVNMTIENVLDVGQTLIIPNIAWGSYKLMATQCGLTFADYEMFEDDHFNMTSFKDTIIHTMKTQDKILVLINDPCHNPTGYSMSKEEWKEVIAFLNECSKQCPIVLLDDIAYIDYSQDLEHSRDYMEVFNDIAENVLVCIAFSCSKTLTSYGLRLGASVVLGKNPETLREVEIEYQKTARATWSNCPNAVMDNFTWVTTDNLEAFNAEKDIYIDLLKKRADIFLSEAKEVGLDTYPYKEGFFVTLRFPDNARRDEVHKALMDNHIYTVCANKGIRVGLCSTSIKKCTGLAKKIKEVMNS